MLLQLDPVAVQQLQAVLLGSSRAATLKLVRACPQLLELDRGELIARLGGGGGGGGGGAPEAQGMARVCFHCV